MQKELLDYHEALEKTEKSKAQWTRDELEDLEEPMMNPEILHKTLEAAMIGIDETQYIRCNPLYSVFFVNSQGYNPTQKHPICWIPN